MNEVFIIGKVISKIEYKFIIKNKTQFAKAKFSVKVDKQIIKVIGYNNIADFCLKYLTKNYNVFINGIIKTNADIIVKTIKIL